MTPIYIGISLFLAIGLWLLGRGLRRFWQRKWVRGSMQGLSGALCLSIAALSIAIAMNLYTYQIFTQEQEVAQVRIEALGPQYFRLYVISHPQQALTYELRGDEWQIDARMIKWHGLASLAGLKTVYRLERISGRYRDITQERSDIRTVHSLATISGVDLWQFSKRYQSYMPWVDAVYGSAAYLPLTHNAQYKVMVSQSGLLIRADNNVAQEAIKNWR